MVSERAFEMIVDAAWIAKTRAEAAEITVETMRQDLEEADKRSDRLKVKFTEATKLLERADRGGSVPNDKPLGEYSSACQVGTEIHRFVKSLHNYYTKSC